MRDEGRGIREVGARGGVSELGRGQKESKGGGRRDERGDSGEVSDEEGETREDGEGVRDEVCDFRQFGAGDAPKQTGSETLSTTVPIP